MVIQVNSTHSDEPKKLPQLARLFASLLLGCLLGGLFGMNSTAKYDILVSEAVIRTSISQPVQIRNDTLYNDAKVLPPGIAAPTTDLYFRRLWGYPDEDLPFQPKYLVTFTVGAKQKYMVNAAISKFSTNWTIVLFHYDGRINEWDEFEWSQRVIHISARKQSKWWFAKRFLHPDVVAPFEYIFIWDEDLDLEHFDAEEYVNLIKKHGLEISQPGLASYKRLTWPLTERLKNSEVHKNVVEMKGHCENPFKPPCAAFVEIMAPVFSKSSWRCVWLLLQNDLIHGWGLDLFMERCIERAYERIGVVDAQYVGHKGVPSLGDQGESMNGESPWEGVMKRCRFELQVFRERMRYAEQLQQSGKA